MTELVHDQAAFRALEERCLEHRLQFVQRLARRRLCHRHRARRLVQRLVIVERDKQLKLLHAQPRHQHLQRVFHVSRKSDRRLETITIPRSIPDTGLTMTSGTSPTVLNRGNRVMPTLARET
nr:hypothetical protein [Paraburkholderia sartisoli]